MALHSAQEADLVAKIRKIHQDVIKTMPDHRIAEELAELTVKADPEDIVDQVVLSEYEAAAVRRGLVTNPKRRRKNPEEEKAYTVYAGWADHAVRPAKWQRYRTWVDPSDPNGPEYALLENWNWFAPNAKFFFITRRDDDVILARLEKDGSGEVTIVNAFQEPTEEALARAFAAGEIKRLIKTPNPREGNPKRATQRRRKNAKGLKIPELDKLGAYYESAQRGADGSIRFFGDWGDVRVHPYGDGTWWWRRFDEFGLADENHDGQTFERAVREATLEPNPKKRLVAGGKVPKGLSKTMAKRKAKAKATAKAKKNPQPWEPHTAEERDRATIHAYAHLLALQGINNWFQVHPGHTQSVPREGDFPARGAKFRRRLYELRKEVMEKDLFSKYPIEDFNYLVEAKRASMLTGEPPALSPYFPQELPEWFERFPEYNPKKRLVAGGKVPKGLSKTMAKRKAKAKKNPCIGLHFHAKDADELLEAAEKSGKRQGNPKKKLYSKLLITKSHRLWQAYDEKPLKKHLLAFGEHIEVMKASGEAELKEETRNATRAFKAELKKHGWKKPAAKRKSKARKNPIGLGRHGNIYVPAEATAEQIAEILNEDQRIASDVQADGYATTHGLGRKVHNDMLLAGEVPGWKMWEHQYTFQPIHGWPEERSHYRIAPEPESNPRKKKASKKKSTKKKSKRKNPAPPPFHKSSARTVIRKGAREMSDREIIAAYDQGHNEPPRGLEYVSGDRGDEIWGWDGWETIDPPQTSEWAKDIDGESWGVVWEDITSSGDEQQVFEYVYWRRARPGRAKGADIHNQFRSDEYLREPEVKVLTLVEGHIAAGDRSANPKKKAKRNPPTGAAAGEDIRRRLDALMPSPSTRNRGWMPLRKLHTHHFGEYNRGTFDDAIRPLVDDGEFELGDGGNQIRRTQRMKYQFNPRKKKAAKKRVRNSGRVPVMVDITDLDKAEVLMALFNYPGGPEMDIYQARRAIEEQPSALHLNFDYLHGKPLKVNLSGDSFDAWGYDRDHGAGAAESAIAGLEGSFARGARSALRKTREDNPKKKAAKKKTLGGRAKRAGRKIEKRGKVLAVDAERGAEKAGRKLKKYGATKQGYTVAGAGLGAILLGPLGAVAGAMGGSALHDNPGAMMNPTALNEMLRLRLPEMSDKEVVDVYEQYYTMYTESARPEMDYGEEGVELIRSVIKDTSEEIRRRDLKSNPKKKKGSKLKTKAKKAGRKAKKFAKTKEGYGALGAGAGALLLGPIGAVAGAIGGTKLHGNPGRRKNPTKGQHHALADRKWNMFESSWDSFSISNSPEDLLGAYMAVVQAELHYAHAGIENDEGRGYGPAGAEAEGIRQQISERLGG